ncbi:hypothetical protein J1614_000760 [Plenodomus biglobosus]|nr:hypothetical protein J1614_000760 [Plenodomus biglobosus]
MTPAMIERSQAAVASLRRSHQQAIQRDEAHRGFQQLQSSRPILSATEFELQVQIRRLELTAKKRQEALNAARAHSEAALASFSKGWSMAPALPALQSMGLPQQMGPFYNQHAYAAQGYPHVGQQYPTNQYPGHGQIPYSMPPGPMLPGPNDAMNNGQDQQALQSQRPQFSTAQQQREQAQHHVASSESDSEDLPLKLRARPQPFAEHASSSKPPAPPKTSPETPHDPDDSEDSNIDIQPKSIDRSSPALVIDFTLPRYEVQRQPLGGKEDVPSAKVSLPGLVREELLLSPDHADQEVHLLVNLFLPSQQQLETPDAEPATAVLNFHNIAVMVIEAFVQFEIGDEFGTGRGHWHNDHDEDGEGEYMRLRDAKDANPDEIFFAVIDRWRAGIESGRKGVLLIRGAQEFCDVALDIIYYVKEHGLLKPEPKTKKDKGKVKAKSEEEQGTEDKGKKRGAQKVVNDVKPRKKAKTTPAKAAPAKGKAAKAKVTVSKSVVVVKKKT